MGKLKSPRLIKSVQKKSIASCLCVTQKTSVDRGIDGSLPRRQVHTEMILEFPSNLALRDGIEVRVVQNCLHSTVNVRVRRPSRIEFASGIRSCGGYCNIEVVCGWSRERLMISLPSFCLWIAKTAIGGVPSRLISRWRGIGPVAELRWRWREATGMVGFIVCLAAIDRGTRFWITFVLQLRWGNPRSNAMVRALIPKLIFLENCRWTNVEADIGIQGSHNHSMTSTGSSGGRICLHPTSSKVSILRSSKK